MPVPGRGVFGLVREITIGDAAERFPQHEAVAKLKASGRPLTPDEITRIDAAYVARQLPFPASYYMPSEQRAEALREAARRDSGATVRVLEKLAHPCGWLVAATVLGWCCHYQVADCARTTLS